MCDNNGILWVYDTVFIHRSHWTQAIAQMNFFTKFWKKWFLHKYILFLLQKFGKRRVTWKTFMKNENNNWPLWCVSESLTYFCFSFVVVLSLLTICTHSPFDFLQSTIKYLIHEFMNCILFAAAKEAERPNNNIWAFIRRASATNATYTFSYRWIVCMVVVGERNKEIEKRILVIMHSPNDWLQKNSIK